MPIPTYQKLDILFFLLCLFVGLVDLFVGSAIIANCFIHLCLGWGIFYVTLGFFQKDYKWMQIFPIIFFFLIYITAVRGQYKAVSSDQGANRSLKIVSYNLWHQRLNSKLLIQTVHQHKADIYVFNELGNKAKKQLKELIKIYPY